MDRGEWKILGVLTLFAAVLLFFVSQDSYFNDLYSRTDSAWFFMGGKAWMNGLVPYVDFADSKGPILWLIYGLGYLIDRSSYVGMYWISCLWYGVTFFFTYKLARIFTKDRRKALICTFLMAFAYFSPWFHLEVRAEDFCLLFMVISLYRVCLLMYSGPVEDREILWTCAILGACFAALLLIKFNIAAMQAIFILCALYFLVREKRNLLKRLLYGIGGFAAVSVPFLVYFLVEGNFTDFIREYFVRTTQTVNPADGSFTDLVLMYIREWSDVSRPDCGGLLILLVLGGLLFARREKGRYRWMPLVVSLFVYAVTMRHHKVVFMQYYFNICSFMLIFLVMDLVSFFGDKVRPLYIFGTAAASLLLVALLNYHSTTHSVACFRDTYERHEYYKVSCIMSQVEKPRLAYAYWYEQGYGTPAGALPAGKYWVMQGGMTEEMMAEHESLLLSGKADFIIAPLDALGQDGRISVAQLADAGYKECTRFFNQMTFALYTKRDGIDADNFGSPSARDVLLKRTRFVEGEWK